MLSENFIQKMKTNLEKEKKQVQKKIADLKKSEKHIDNPDLSDTAYDASEDILEESLVATYRDLERRIDDALLRIKNGTYGKCLKTNKEIPEMLLEKEPWAEFCNTK